MTSRLQVRILCEGPDDLAALRELLTRRWGFKASRVPMPPAGADRVQPMEKGTAKLSIRAVAGRPDLPVQWPKLITQGSPSEPVEAIGVSFDPNGTEESAWRRLLFEAAAFPMSKQADGTYLALVDEAREIPIVPLPWWAEVPVYANLPDHHLLERLLIAASHAIDPTRSRLVQRWVEETRTAELEPTWKTAARLWHALLFPERGTHDFASQVFGQHAELWNALSPKMLATPFWRGMALLFDDPIA